MAVPEGTIPEGLGLPVLNALPASDAERVLAACCASPRWVSAVAAGRPYASPEQLFAAADDALADLDEDDVSRALAGHPRIGERAEGEGGAWSRREQSGVSGAEASTLQALVDGNLSYEAKFGQVYLVCASGRSAEELLAVLQQRLRNDPETERSVVRRELGLINRIRLGRLVEDTAV
jgi:2-oxo-4-hydroxy-4-carboxy-5-ureidoimidazoline decarboxylase